MKNTEAARKLRRKAEELVAAQPVFTGETDAKRLLHELQVHQVELEMQNEELRQANAEISEHKEHLLNIIKKTPAGYFHIDLEGRFLDVNDAFLHMHGYDSADEVIGQHFSMIQVDGSSDSALAHLAELQSGVQTPHGEFCHRRKDGSIGHHIYSAHPVERLGTIVGFEWFIIDTTERRQAEDVRETLIARLNEKSKEMEEVLHVTSHDLRSPLVTIQGFSDILETFLDEMSSVAENESLSPEIKAKIVSGIKVSRTAMTYISKSILKMGALLDGLSQVANLGRIEMKAKALDMNMLISDILSQVEIQRQKKGVTIETSELPLCTGDPDQINQLFANLIGNALKYTAPERPGVIKVSGLKEGDYSIYCVEDNGLGLAPESHESIFEIYKQLNQNAEGEGLGLTIVRKIAERHNGKVWVESELGKGSKFYVCLPYV